MVSCPMSRADPFVAPGFMKLTSDMRGAAPPLRGVPLDGWVRQHHGTLPGNEKVFPRLLER